MPQQVDGSLLQESARRFKSIAIAHRLKSHSGMSVPYIKKPLKATLVALKIIGSGDLKLHLFQDRHSLLGPNWSDDR